MVSVPLTGSILVEIRLTKISNASLSRFHDGPISVIAGTVQPILVLPDQTVPMVARPTMSNRWEYTIAVPANVKSIVLTVRGVSQNTMSRSGGSYAGVGTDSLVTQVSLRNAFRP